MQGKAQPLLLSPEPLTPSARHGQGPGSWELGRPGHQGHLPRPEKSTAPTLRNLDLPDPACPPYHQRDKTRGLGFGLRRENHKGHTTALDVGPRLLVN